MPDMTGRHCLLLIVAASLLPVGCSSERDRQWYDRDECTKGRELDEQCMKQRGWVPLTSDREPAGTPPKPAQSPRGPRY